MLTKYNHYLKIKMLFLNSLVLILICLMRMLLFYKFGRKKCCLNKNVPLEIITGTKYLREFLFSFQDRLKHL